MDRVFAIHDRWLTSPELNDPPVVKRILDRRCPMSLDKVIIVSDESECVDKIDGKKVIPIGDITFLRRWLKALGAKDPDMTPIEIPQEIRQFLGKRNYIICDGLEVLEKYHDGSKWFVKDVSELKRWNSNVYEGFDLSYYIDKNAKYSVTERIAFASEYRVMVHRDEVLGVMPYLGNPLVFPDASAIQGMVFAYSKADHPKSYTLDIGVVADGYADYGRTVPIEVHPFAACGLYGFSDNSLPEMYEDGFSWYL